MNKLAISFAGLSIQYEDRLLESHGDSLFSVLEKLVETYGELEVKRMIMDNNTGSISTAAGLFLYLATKYFSPTIICEIGTFIGKSATSLAFGLAEAPQDSMLYTCDMHNDCFLDDVICDTEIISYPKMSSTTMLEDLVKKNIHVDMFFLDGRVQVNDIGLLRQLKHEDTIFCLDDFVGTEKGVANAILLQQELLPEYFLLPSSNRQLFKHLGIASTHSIATLIPPSVVISRQ